MSRVDDARADCESGEFRCAQVLRRIVARGHLTPALLAESTEAVRELDGYEKNLFRAAHPARRRVAR